MTKAILGSAIFVAIVLLAQPVKAQSPQQNSQSLPALLQQGFEIKGMSYNIGVLVQKGTVVYVCGWGSDYKSSCTQIN